MLEERFFTAGKALKLIFIGQVIALFVSLPNVGNLISLIAGITILVGIVKIRKADALYNRAFIMVLCSLGCSLVLSMATVYFSSLYADGNLGAAQTFMIVALILSVVAAVFGFLQNFFIIKGTTKFCVGLFLCIHSRWPEFCVQYSVFRLTAVCIRLVQRPVACQQRREYGDHLRLHPVLIPQ